LSCDVYMKNATWQTMTRIEVGVGDLVQRIEDDQTQVRYSVVR
jgi:hypothetical protein